MKIDSYGQCILDQLEICELFMQNPEFRPQYILSADAAIDSRVELEYQPPIVAYTPSDQSIEEFDASLQQNWLMPPEYQQLDIAKWLLDRCETDEQRQRVGQELLLYLERDLFPLLQYLKYIVDTMRSNGIIWGVGRGSSVSSYVLYLIGVHRIDSMYWDLDVTEFLK